MLKRKAETRPKVYQETFYIVIFIFIILTHLIAFDQKPSAEIRLFDRQSLKCDLMDMLLLWFPL